MRKPRIFCVLMLIYLCSSVPIMAADGPATPGLWSQLVDLWQRVIATVTGSDGDLAAHSPTASGPDGGSGEHLPVLVPNG